MGSTWPKLVHITADQEVKNQAKCGCSLQGSAPLPVTYARPPGPNSQFLLQIILHTGNEVTTLGTVPLCSDWDGGRSELERLRSLECS